MFSILNQQTPFTLLAERDMDLLVLEEMHASKPFRDWLVSKLFNNTRRVLDFLGAYHTFSLDPLGSVDILFLFRDVSGRKCSVLIENKIDQPKQNLQAQRYFEFGEKGVEEGGWDEYLTCLFSPQAYFATLEPSEYFSSYLSYEEMEGWFQNQAVRLSSILPDRASYKINLIRKAIEQGTGMLRRQDASAPAAAPVGPDTPAPADAAVNAPVPESAPEQPAPVEIQPKKKVSASDFRVFPGGVFNLPPGYREAEDTIIGHFWNDYLDFAQKKYPDLGMKKPTGSAEEAAWVEMTPAAFPREVKIIHKMPQGFMDLTFAMASPAVIQPTYRPYMDSDMTVRENGTATVIRIGVPPIDPQSGFDAQKDLLNFALQKAYKLFQLYLHVVGGMGKTSTSYAPEELYL